MESNLQIYLPAVDQAVHDVLLVHIQLGHGSLLGVSEELSQTQLLLVQGLPSHHPLTGDFAISSLW